MSRSPSKRARSENSERDVQSDSETDTTVSRSKKYSIYDDPRYETVLANKDSFIRNSEQGPLPEERTFYKTLFTRAPIPKDLIFKEEQLL